ncbi:OmpA family protein [Thermomonospora curvata]|uniref:OmpA/MotB domain protein n=1 Tax=Thermomonospora curvata (strain ATCC 19995 / DSM 43183 / JCM 3096 / KCTC 9072 / NBRC 15933 / NCIMB 10081 / Henssen B9) TaxID=471852 RepID=D1ADZ5_THECD|nr:OmpA family protein [Thermomonospora curvata]ACY99421.1 OmpA/MotB domain protein [Thermomonospora curvata DSM 43183]
MRTRTALTAAALAALLTVPLGGAAVAAPSPSPSSWPEPGTDGSGRRAGEGRPKTIAIPPPGTLQQNRKYYTPIEETTEKGRKSFTLQADVLFKTGSADLSAAAEKYLADVVAKLKEANVTGEVQVVGHTDDVGEPEDNLALSKRRAEAVVQAMQPQLANTGITLIPEGKGESEPREKGTSPQARQRNRRVSILYGKASGDPPPRPDPRYISVPVTETAPDPGLRPLPGEPAPLASTQRTINGTWTVRLDVVELRRQGPFLKVGYRTRLVAQRGTSGLNYPALFDGDTNGFDGYGYHATLIDKAHGEELSVVITGRGVPMRDWLGGNEKVGAVKYGWALFPQPSQKTDRLSFYIPAFGTIDDLPVG